MCVCVCVAKYLMRYVATSGPLIEGRCFLPAPFPISFLELLQAQAKCEIIPWSCSFSHHPPNFTACIEDNF